MRAQTQKIGVLYNTSILVQKECDFSVMVNDSLSRSVSPQFTLGYWIVDASVSLVSGCATSMTPTHTCDVSSWQTMKMCAPISSHLCMLLVLFVHKWIWVWVCERVLCSSPFLLLLWIEHCVLFSYTVHIVYCYGWMTAVAVVDCRINFVHDKTVVVVVLCESY